MFLMLSGCREETQAPTVAAEAPKERPRKRKADVAIVSRLKGSTTNMQMLFFIFQLHADEDFLQPRESSVNKKTLGLFNLCILEFFLTKPGSPMV